VNKESLGKEWKVADRERER